MKLPDNCCFAKNAMKLRGHSLNSMNYIYIYIYNVYFGCRFSFRHILLITDKDLIFSFSRWRTRYHNFSLKTVQSFNWCSRNTGTSIIFGRCQRRGYSCTGECQIYCVLKEFLERVCLSLADDVMYEHVNHWYLFESVQIAAKDHMTVNPSRLWDFVPMSTAFYNSRPPR